MMTTVLVTQWFVLFILYIIHVLDFYTILHNVLVLTCSISYILHLLWIIECYIKQTKFLMVMMALIMGDD
jgi:hypothetical protein